MMTKQRAIRIIVNAAKLYKENLENQKILFLYGIPSEVKKQIIQGEKLSAIKSYEVAFNKCNFLHLTGVRLRKNNIKSSYHFYQKCIDNRLMEDDFEFAKDGSTRQKLDILEDIMKIKKNANMIGEFTDCGIKLYTEKVTGGTYGCVGFVKDIRTGLNVPNTVLNKDIRDITKKPCEKVYAILSKQHRDSKYYLIEKLDKSIDIGKHIFLKEIENKLDREKLN